MNVEVQCQFFRQLKCAVESQDPRKVEETLKKLEKKGFPIAQFMAMQEECGCTLLHFAVRHGNLDILRQLLEYSDEERVNQVSTCDSSPPILLLLQRYQRLVSAEEMLLSLLAAKANPNLSHPSVTCRHCNADFPVTPLVYALQERLWQMAEILLDAGANPHKRGCGCRPINSCLEKPDLVQRLLDLGCYYYDFLGYVITTDYEGKCEESTLRLCKMILPYHSYVGFSSANQSS